MSNTIGQDMICPITKEHCDDECCTVGSECNINGDSLQPPDNTLEILIKAVKNMKDKDKTSLSFIDIMKPTSMLYNYCAANNLILPNG